MSELTAAQIRQMVEGFPDRGPYWFAKEDKLPFYDFNREVYEPGVMPQAPEGFVGIRCDDDFWSVAHLPYDFVDTPLRVIVETLWPGIRDFELGPDSEMPAYYKEHGFPTDEMTQ